MSEDAYKIHGYSDEFLSNKKKFSEIVEEFLLFIEDKKIIIHNSEFDIGHLNNELSIIGKNKISKNNIVDTLDLARNKFPGSSISLDALCKRFRIDNSRREKHSALVDCELLAKVYINLLDQREPKLNFTSFDEKKEFQNQSNIIYSKKVIKLTSLELDNHKSFLKKNVKKNFF